VELWLATFLDVDGLLSGLELFCVSDVRLLCDAWPPPSEFSLSDSLTAVGAPGHRLLRCSVISGEEGADSSSFAEGLAAVTLIVE
jgi:hypothetical protein